MARPWNTSLTDDWYEDEEENVVATIAAQERGARAHDAAMLNGWDPDELIRRAHRRLNAAQTTTARVRLAAMVSSTYAEMERNAGKCVYCDANAVRDSRCAKHLPEEG